ncbi:MAG: hypothetical protein HY238_20100 [Acidobacteria bacterium]|nr:hypothetical protein [Acidobacteriota bacterium]
MNQSSIRLCFLIVFVIVSRAVFWTAHPPNFDYANFALGVHRYAPADHQPQPPGYPLAILTARLLLAAGVSALRALQMTALAGSILAALGGYALARRLSGELGGLLACGLLALDPIVWYSGVNSPVRTYLAAGVCWLLCALLELSGGRMSFLWISAALLALAGGFRPELPAFFAVPFLVAARLGGAPWRRIFLAWAFSMALCAPWVWWIAASFGSLSRMVYVYYQYFLHHASTTSVFLGAPAGAWQGMLRDSLLWNSLAAMVTLLALIASRGRARIDRRFAWLAGTYFVPALIVQLGIHQAAPDHSLGTIAVLWVVAAALLGTARVLWVPALAAMAMLAISLAPPRTLMPQLDVLSLRSFAQSQRALDGMIRDLQTALQPGDAIVALDDSPVSWRTLEYEFPQTLLVVLHAAVGSNPADPPTGWQFLGGRLTATVEREVVLTGVERLHVASNPAGPQRPLVRDRLCIASRCEDRGWRVQVAIGTRREPVSLPPYTLRF